jgi:hypothetical protein
MSSTYEEYTNDFGNKYIARTDEDGKVWWIPTNPANSDYQAYLNKDKPVEHFTPSLTNAKEL